LSELNSKSIIYHTDNDIIGRERLGLAPIQQ